MSEWNGPFLPDYAAARAKVGAREVGPTPRRSRRRRGRNHKVLSLRRAAGAALIRLGERLLGPGQSGIFRPVLVAASSREDRSRSAHFEFTTSKSGTY